MTRAELRLAARRILRAGLAAVEPGRLVRKHIVRDEGGLRIAGLRLRKSDRVFVVSVGKAAFAMARSALKALGTRVTDSIVIAPEAPARMARTRVFVAGHPIPNAAGVRAGREVMRLLEGAGSSDVVLLLLSGGASALMPAPVLGVSLRDKQRVTRLLLARGASISEINSVRKRLSRLKGGGFARLAAPARVITLALSDVPGDDIGTIGSGPAIEDPKAAPLARRTLRKYLKSDEAPMAVRQALSRRDRPAPCRGRGRALVIGSGRTFAFAAARVSRDLGLRTMCLPDALRGEARVAGPALVRRFARWRGDEISCLIATGETVVHVQGKGQGGRNQELALAAVPVLAQLHRPTVLASLATDGRDGRSEASGGLVDDETHGIALARGVSVPAVLDRNDSTPALRRLGCLILTGPTGTNVADITVVVG